jgi:hypothetical protein
MDDARSPEMDDLIQVMLCENSDTRATIDDLQIHLKIRGVKVEGDCADQEKTLLDVAFHQSALILETKRRNPIDGEAP